MSSSRKRVNEENEGVSKRSKINHATSESEDEDPPMALTIDNKVVAPTPHFDTFWKFAADRNSAHINRRKGLPAPWTDNEVLNTHRFCNVYRVLDRASQYLIREVIEKGSQEPVEVIFRVVLFSTFTKIKTYQHLLKRIRSLTWATYTRDKYEGVLRPLYSRGVTLYTGSYIKPAANLGYSENFMNHLVILEDLMEELPEQLANAKFLVDVYKWLLTKPSMGEFTAYQLLLNLSYTSAMNFSEFDFVAVGLGARAGLRQCFGESLPRSLEVTVIRWMQATQYDHFERLGLSFDGLGSNRAPLMLCDIEHTLCELDKYVRVTTGVSRGRPYTPSDAEPLEPLCLPKAWESCAREKCRIKTKKEANWSTDLVEKYDVESIIAHKVVKGQTQLRVRWRGYTEEDNTWEPESVLVQDAPLAVESYWAMVNSNSASSRNI
ncbi:hypothetical protein BJ138DRAFT_1076001 [Hygrophoropsis aurantiaca]|uniref:Uncharacterized protein n=1 Tax=Hygrophoropsis aurantiaca TaxID=72124 RepID=A0ACB8AS50_9AGAM|nr:hypothetical protein BJ138DRAFT_1076001 [Hygrophoropsis aurantiaca]